MKNAANWTNEAGALHPDHLLLAALPFVERPSLDANSAVSRPDIWKARTVPVHDELVITYEINGIDESPMDGAIRTQAQS